MDLSTFFVSFVFPEKKANCKLTQLITVYMTFRQQSRSYNWPLESRKYNDFSKTQKCLFFDLHDERNPCHCRRQLRQYTGYYALTKHAKKSVSISTTVNQKLQ